MASAVLLQRKDAVAPAPAVLAALPGLLAQALRLPEVRVVSAVDDYLVNFNRLGGWEPWARHLGAGTTVMGAPTYVALVLLEKSMGRATSVAVEHALASNRPVFLVTGPETTLAPVTGIDRCEGNDYADWANAQTDKKDDFAKWCAWQIQFPQVRT